MGSELHTFAARTRMRIRGAFCALLMSENERACGAESARAFIHLRDARFLCAFASASKLVFRRPGISQRVQR